MGTQTLAPSSLFSAFNIFFLMKSNNSAAIMPPNNGDIIQLAAILDIVLQFTMEKPAAPIPPPKTPPTIEWVVDTGAFKIVARFIQSAADNNAASIMIWNLPTSSASPGDTIPLATVFTTSPPASNAPAASQIAAMITAVATVKTFPPTAGPILLATSLAPMFIAI